MEKIGLLKQYLDRGWYIFPCKKDKSPITANGYKDASNNIETLKLWEKNYPGCNWGLPLEQSNLSVIDVDPRNGGYFKEDFLIGSNGLEYKLPPTLLVKTGGGGYHLYYQGARKLPKGLVEGIDFKSIGGYVIIPPSIHESGNLYEWINELPIAPFPEYLIFEEPKKGKYTVPEIIQEGERNNILFKLGSSLRSKGFGEDEIYSALFTANQRCNPPLKECELATITNSVLRYEPNEIIEPGLYFEKELTLTDLGNLERFVSLYKDKVRYCNELKTWFIWNGKYWKKDNSLEVKSLAKEVIKKIYQEASQTNDRTLQEKISSWAKSSHAEYRIEAMLDLAKSELPISPSDLDIHDYLLNLNNGVYDLKTGELFLHNPKYYFTQIIEINYLPNSECNNWKKFLDLVIPDIDSQKFIQKAIGYSLTGSVDEQCLFFCYGKGANGKSTFIEAVSRLFGDLYQKTDAESLMGYSEGATPYKARMRGKRFIVSSEIPDGKKWNETLIKDLTGGETLVARDIYQSPYEFKPTFKIWITGNYKPKVQDDSYGFWRRIRLIPFETTIQESQRKPMPQVLNSFDYSGILNWAIAGYKLWQEDGLKPSEKVSKATEEYKNEQDILQDFIDEFCIFGDGYRIAKNDFRTTFTKYQKESGYHLEFSSKKFTGVLSEKGIPVGGSGNGYYIGVTLTPKESLEEHIQVKQ